MVAISIVVQYRKSRLSKEDSCRSRPHSMTFWAPLFCSKTPPHNSITDGFGPSLFMNFGNAISIFLLLVNFSRFCPTLPSLSTFVLPLRMMTVFPPELNVLRILKHSGVGYTLTMMLWFCLTLQLLASFLFYFIFVISLENQLLYVFDL